MKRMNSLNRRQIFQFAGAGLAGLPLSYRQVPQSAAVAASASQSGLAPLNRFPRMLQEYYVEQVRNAERESLKAKLALKTKQDAEAYVRSVREKIRICFGPLPDRTPLNPRVSRKVERDAYSIEMVIFESRPRFMVTANLYIPKGKNGPFPGVLGTCGHTANGKAAETYQAFAQGLARLGYVVLLIDPIGQGERLQYVNSELKPRRGTGTSEHLYAGNRQYLIGEFFGTWRAWDGIRALDYLLTRPEVDKRYIGITGNSGGGTMTTWLCGLDQRWTMAAPGCFVTTFRRNMENELPADTEQCPPQALSLRLDHDDFLAALAPKPVIILAKERDYFDVRGSEEAYGRLKNLYKLLDAENNISLSVGPTEHGFTQESREAMYRWFTRFSALPEISAEPKLVIEKDETLWCTPGGQVAGLDSRPIYAFTEERAKNLAKQRPEKGGAELENAIRKTLHILDRRNVPEYRILRPISGRRYPLANFTTYAVETEPNVFALVYRLSKNTHLSRPARFDQPAVLYIAHQSSDVELREEPLISELLAAEPESVFYACDVRGIGESRPNTCGEQRSDSPYGSDYFYAAYALMLDYPVAGQRAYDVLKVLDWLASFGHTAIHLAAKGWGTIPATFAAILSPSVVRITLKNAPRSYTEIAESEDYSCPLALLPQGLLHYFDLPDCYRELKKKSLRIIDAVGSRL